MATESTGTDPRRSRPTVVQPYEMHRQTRREAWPRSGARIPSMRPSGSGWSPAWRSLNGRDIPRQKGGEVCLVSSRAVILASSDECHGFLFAATTSQAHSNNR